MHRSIGNSLIYFLILTLIGSALAYRIVVKAYETAYDDYLIEYLKK